MSTHQFIQQNSTRIQNMDGNLDDGNITILRSDGKLEFYFFVDGVMVDPGV